MAVCCIGCSNTPPGAGLRYEDASVGCPKDADAILTLAGAPVRVKIDCKISGSNVQLRLKAHDTVFEEEGYVQGPDNFGLADAAGTTFDPPVPLLKVPMAVGDSWKWQGSTSDGGPKRDSTAMITTTGERFFTSDGGLDVVKVQVDLEMSSGGPTPAKRKLEFWLAPKQGVLKRKFGNSSIREPAPKE